jgi:2-polyprenyl-3-methyl-5-hydroxy-6-metoxy-1,4-benzoquinol methylase
MAYDDGVLAYVRAALGAPPARVLEVGAGDGWLARALRGGGFDVVAIDPGAGEDAAGVRPIGLADLDASSGAFDAAVAVLSLHHVEPLEEAMARLAAVVRPGGRLIVDEFDVSRVDERAAAWWLARYEGDHAARPAAELVADLRAHIHPVARLLDALSGAFAIGEPVPGPYLHRWSLPPGLRDDEEHAIATGAIPATGVRFVGVRRH